MPQGATLSCIGLALGIAGLNARKWKNQSTRPLFILAPVTGLTFTLLFFTQLRRFPGESPLNLARACFYTVNLICLFGYAIAFRGRRKIDVSTA